MKVSQHRIVGASLAFACSMLLSACVVTPDGGRYYGGVDVRVAPPPDRIVAVPGPRRGYIWAPGYWGWNGRTHIWSDGRWMRERRGSHWVPDHWVERDGRYRLERGHWER